MIGSLGAMTPDFAWPDQNRPELITDSARIAGIANLLFHISRNLYFRVPCYKSIQLIKVLDLLAM